MSELKDPEISRLLAENQVLADELAHCQRAAFAKCYFVICQGALLSIQLRDSNQHKPYIRLLIITLRILKSLSFAKSHGKAFQAFTVGLLDNTLGSVIITKLDWFRADKDFVWSLWKQLQVANPDITHAVSLVVQREKEKAEIKDRKVLEILQVKDEKIEELNGIISSQAKEITQLISKSSELEVKNSHLHSEGGSLKDEIAILENRLQILEGKEKASDDIHKSSLDKYEAENYALRKKVNELESGLEKTKTDKVAISTHRIDLEGKVWSLEREVSENISKFKGVIEESEKLKQLLNNCEIRIPQYEREIDDKNTELEKVRKELSELWTSHHQLTEHSGQQAELICQLQSLQQDTQKMLKNQEDTFSLETTTQQQLYVDMVLKYEQARKSEIDHKHQLIIIQNKLKLKDDEIEQLQNEIGRTSKMVHKSVGVQNSLVFPCENDGNDMVPFEHIQRMQTEIESLKSELAENNRRLCNANRAETSRLHERLHITGGQTFSTPKAKSQASFLDASPPAVSPLHSHPESQETQITQLRTKITNLEKSLQDCRILIQLKDGELEQMREAHDQRLERFKSLKRNYHLVKDQLKMMEGDYPRSERKSITRRAHPKTLQQETSDTVWNELAYFRNENKQLMLERLETQEQIDVLKVHVSHDTATIHELRLTLEKQKEDYEYLLERKVQGEIEKRQAEIEKRQREIKTIRKELSITKDKAQKLNIDLQEMSDERDSLLQEKMSLKMEIVQLKQNSAKYRIEIASLNQDSHRLQRLVEKLRFSDLKYDSAKNSQTHHPHKRRRKHGTSIAKQYQKILNKSIEKMQTLFKDFDKDDWEEISDSETIQEDSAETDDVLHVPAPFVKLTSSSNDIISSSKEPRVSVRSSKKHQAPKGKKSKNQMSKQILCTNKENVLLQDASTSPCFFPSQNCITGKKATKQSRNLVQLQQKLFSLQQEVKIIKDSRETAVKSLGIHKEACDHLQSELAIANQKVKVGRQNIKRFQQEVERLQQQKDSLEREVRKDENKNTSCSSIYHSEQDWKGLENRVKVSSNELTRQANTVKNLRVENDKLQEKLKILQDRINKLERDNSQKRTLLDDQKLKMKLAQENAKSAAGSQECLEMKLKVSNEVSEKSKAQIVSLRKQLAAVTKEKSEQEEKYRKITQELEKKSKQFNESHAKKEELETAVNDLEQAAHHHLHELASQSERAIELAQTKLRGAHNRLACFHRFVKTLAHEIMLQTQQTRSVLKLKEVKKEKTHDPSSSFLLRAQSVAKDILEISQSDLEDIMKADSLPVRMEPNLVSESHVDKSWFENCEKVVNTKEDFVMPLVDLFIQKLEEKDRLMTKLNRC